MKVSTIVIMNFLCHAIPYLSDPLVAISTGVPDWLNVVDRRIRARKKYALEYLDSDDHELRCVARGIVHHHEDDQWFHGTQAFAETNMTLAVQLRELLPGDEGFRPTFVGHILVEILLDAISIDEDRLRAEQYYQSFTDQHGETIQRCVNIITGKSADRMSEIISRYAKARFLFDYADDSRLLMRLNQVMNRVKLPVLPDSVMDWFPQVRQLVQQRRDDLLRRPEGFPTII